MCFLENFITETVRKYLNLNNVSNLRMYNGPISFIRREKDEVMNLGERFCFDAATFHITLKILCAPALPPKLQILYAWALPAKNLGGARA